MSASEHAARGPARDTSPFDPAHMRRRLSRLLDFAADGLVVAAADWHITVCTPMAEKILKCSVAEMIGLPLTRFFRADAFHDACAQDSDRVHAGFRRVDALRATGESFAAEIRIALVPSSAQTLRLVFIRDVQLQRWVQRATSKIADALQYSECDLFASAEDAEDDVLDDNVCSAPTAYPPDETLRRLNVSLDRQAKRIAHALHDEAGQVLAAAYNSLSEISRELPPAAVARLGEVRDHLDRIETQLRCLAHELRPRILDDLGLVAAIEFLAAGVASRRHIAVSTDGSLHGRLPAVVETTVYRVVQEALINASRHARPHRIEVVLKHAARALHCSVNDDGVGFDATALENRGGERGFGLLGMREQIELLGGTFQIDSEPGRGTRLTMTVPLSD
jgi:signal transduction histidine kinase